MEQRAGRTQKQTEKHSEKAQKADRQWLTLRVTTAEKMGVAEQAAFAGLSTSEYIRRRLFGGRPVIAQTDEAMLRELRRVGGLLKGNFVTLRNGHVGTDEIALMNAALRELIQCINIIGRQS